MKVFLSNLQFKSNPATSN